MKNIFLIFKNDVMKIHKNVIAMIVIMGITVIPTLYAWFNISASWDPYGNTGELKLAVASDDEGYTGELIAVKITWGIRFFLLYIKINNLTGFSLILKLHRRV